MYTQLIKAFWLFGYTRCFISSGRPLSPAVPPWWVLADLCRYWSSWASVTLCSLIENVSILVTHFAQIFKQPRDCTKLLIPSWQHLKAFTAFYYHGSSSRRNVSTNLFVLQSNGWSVAKVSFSFLLKTSMMLMTHPLALKTFPHSRNRILSAICKLHVFR